MNVKKKHLKGGRLRKAMAATIIEVMQEVAKQDNPSALFYERCAVELGTHHRTLRVWTGPLEQGGWEELQVKGGMEALIKASRRKKPTKKPSVA